MQSTLECKKEGAQQQEAGARQDYQCHHPLLPNCQPAFTCRPQGADPSRPLLLGEPGSRMGREGELSKGLRGGADGALAAATPPPGAGAAAGVAAGAAAGSIASAPCCCAACCSSPSPCAASSSSAAGEAGLEPGCTSCAAAGWRTRRPGGAGLRFPTASSSRFLQQARESRSRASEG